MKISFLILLVTIFHLDIAMSNDEVRLRCTSLDNIRILPIGHDNVVAVELNKTFDGYMSMAGDAGIWSHFKFINKQKGNLRFVSTRPDSSMQAKNLEAMVEEKLVQNKLPGKISFTNLDNPKIIKNYICN